MMTESATSPQADRTVQLYRRARRSRDRLARISGAVFDGLWLGLLSRPQMHELDARFYDERIERVDGQAFRYDDDAYNSRGLSDWEEGAVSDHFPAGARVVVTGAGGGREVLALLERGYDVVGYEPHRGLAAAGADFLSRRGYPRRLLTCERDEFPGEVERCDGLVVGWGSYMLIAGRAQRIAFLRAARRRLSQDDPILLSFFAYRQRPRHFAVVAAVANAVRRLRREERVEVGDALAGNFLHCFTRSEIEAELAEGGFRLVDFRLSPYGHAVALAA